MRKVRIFRCSVALAAVAILAASALVAGAATATRVVVGNLVLDFGFGFAPHALPKTHDTPITVSGHEAVRTRDGTVPPPATHLTFEFNRHGHLETRGLAPARSQAEATSTERASELCPKRARRPRLRRRGRRLSGTGAVRGLDADPLLQRTAGRRRPDPARPRLSRRPVSTTYVDSFRIERIHKGSLGYRVDGDLARIAGGYGSLTSIRFKLGRRWGFDGGAAELHQRPLPRAGSQLVGRGVTEYADGTTLTGSFFGSCQIRPG